MGELDLLVYIISHFSNTIPVVGIGFNPTLYSVEEDSGVVVFVVENRNPDMEREVSSRYSSPPLKERLLVRFLCWYDIML